MRRVYIQCISALSFEGGTEEGPSAALRRSAALSYLDPPWSRVPSSPQPSTSHRRIQVHGSTMLRFLTSQRAASSALLVEHYFAQWGVLYTCTLLSCFSSKVDGINIDREIKEGTHRITIMHTHLTTYSRKKGLIRTTGEVDPLTVCWWRTAR